MTATPTLNLNHLLELNDVAFVEAAYQVLLSRSPDPAGLEYYVNRLRLGHAKNAVVAQIAMSSETGNTPQDLEGLTELKVRHQKSRHWLWRFLERTTRIERQANRLENELGRLTQLGAQRAEQRHAETMNQLNLMQRSMLEHQNSVTRRLDQTQASVADQLTGFSGRQERLQYGLLEKQTEITSRLERIKHSLIEQQSDLAVSLLRLDSRLAEQKATTEIKATNFDAQLVQLQSRVAEISSSLAALAERLRPPVPTEPTESDLSNLSPRARQMFAGVSQARARATFGRSI